MSENNKSYRISANLGGEKVINVNLNQDYDFLEILSLKIGTKNLYRTHTSNYGCIAGRVIANEGIGVPNVKISVFVETNEDKELDSVLFSLYPYANVSTTDESNRRYNLLTDKQISDCHVPIGSFPSKRMVLDDSNVLEIYDKYYKFTTTTNNAGDYMIFGVPTGSCVVHADVDLSDVGFLSQKPRDLIYKGYNINQFENSDQFKKSSDLDNLAQVITENKGVTVYPFWGDEDSGIIAITRNDISLQYKFEPTCVFLGSMVSDSKSGYFGVDCKPTKKLGEMKELVGGNGTIEMIRKTPNDTVESFSVEGRQLIDGDGVWCYQIPMNLDYIVTDEYGNIVPSEGTTKGIPTRTRVRFRMSLTDSASDVENAHLSKILVPNNPNSDSDLDYAFGTLTKDNEEGTKSFRDLIWNNVYTVKSYIPRIQNKSNVGQKFNEFSGFKNISNAEDKNLIPYNNMRVNVTFKFSLACAVFKALLRITKVINKLAFSRGKCVSVGDGMCSQLENWYFAPGCSAKYIRKTAESLGKNDAVDGTSVDDKSGEGRNYCVSREIDYFKQCVELSLAMENEVIQFDFYNDWINGLVYIPRWYADIKRRHKWFFGLFGSNSSFERYCSQSRGFSNTYLYQACALEYTNEGDPDGAYTKVTTSYGCRNHGLGRVLYPSRLNCHKSKATAKIFKSTNVNGGGLVYPHTTLVGQKVYYPKPCEWIKRGGKEYVKVNLFATDIVLLGSLNECDERGVPSAFKDIPSTTYQLPPNMAETNIGADGYLYHTSDQKSTVCSGKQYTVEKIETEKTEDLKSYNYNEWIKNSDFYDPESLDVDYPVTDTAGIDWGYRGPRQKPDNRDKYYAPGGHFLGIGCTNAEVTVKSCVNLSRVCELGATLSKRTSYPYVEEGSDNINRMKYRFSIPNGLISNLEINDNDFREKFATLNSKGLETVYDIQTGRRHYDLINLKPNGFGGELSDKIGEKDADNPYFIDVKEESGAYSDNKAFSAIIESPTPDYYRFRFGINDIAEESKNSFVNVSGRKASFPIYKNSFYFYFGINNGSTAIDKFYSDYYAECPNMKLYESDVEINSTGTTFCGKNDGKIEVIFHNMIPPYTINGYMLDDSDMRTSLKNISGITVNGTPLADRTSNDYIDTKVVFEGLISGRYVFDIDSEETIGVERNVELNESPIVFVNENAIEVIPFSDEYPYTDDVRENMEGFVERFNDNLGGYLISGSTFGLAEGEDANVNVELVGIVFANFGGYRTIAPSGVSITSGMVYDTVSSEYYTSTEDEFINFDEAYSGTVITIDNKYYSLWNQITNYYIYAIIKCKDNDELSLYYVKTESIGHADTFDIVFGNIESRSCTLSKLINVFNISEFTRPVVWFNKYGATDAAGKNNFGYFSKSAGIAVVASGETDSPRGVEDISYMTSYPNNKAKNDGVINGKYGYNWVKSYNKIERTYDFIRGYSAVKWVNDLLSNPNLSGSTEFNFKDAIFLRNSIYTFNGNYVPITLTKAPEDEVEVKITGTTTDIIDENRKENGLVDAKSSFVTFQTLVLSTGFTSGETAFENVFDDVYIASENMHRLNDRSVFGSYQQIRESSVTGTNAWSDYKSLMPYKINATNGDETYDLWLPIIYKPCFTRTYAVIYFSGGTRHLRIMCYGYNLLPTEELSVKMEIQYTSGEMSSAVTFAMSSGKIINDSGMTKYLDDGEKYPMTKCCIPSYQANDESDEPEQEDGSTGCETFVYADCCVLTKDWSGITGNPDFAGESYVLETEIITNSVSLSDETKMSSIRVDGFSQYRTTEDPMRSFYKAMSGGTEVDVVIGSGGTEGYTYVLVNKGYYGEIDPTVQYFRKKKTFDSILGILVSPTESTGNPYSVVYRDTIKEPYTGNKRVNISDVSGNTNPDYQMRYVLATHSLGGWHGKQGSNDSYCYLLDYGESFDIEDIYSTDYYVNQPLSISANSLTSLYAIKDTFTNAGVDLSTDIQLSDSDHKDNLATTQINKKQTMTMSKWRVVDKDTNYSCIMYVYPD